MDSRIIGLVHALEKAESSLQARRLGPHDYSMNDAAAKIAGKLAGIVDYGFSVHYPVPNLRAKLETQGHFASPAEIEMGVRALIEFTYDKLALEAIRNRSREMQYATSIS